MNKLPGKPVFLIPLLVLLCLGFFLSQAQAKTVKREVIRAPVAPSQKPEIKKGKPAITPQQEAILDPTVSAIAPEKCSIWGKFFSATVLEHPVPLRNIEFIKEKKWWVVGDGVILKPVDEWVGGGEHYPAYYPYLPTLPDERFFYDVHFVDSKAGWVAGGGGAHGILHTADGGETWTKQEVPEVPELCRYLLSVEFVDSQHGWATGNCGAILHTADGGKIWTEQISDTSEDLLKVDFVDANNGWIVGRSGTILYTADGGEKWTKQVSGTTKDLFGVAFFDATTGWAVGEDIILHYNGSWASQDILQDSVKYLHLNAVSFINADIVYAVGTHILRTTNGGKVWEKMNVLGGPNELGGLKEPLSDIDCIKGTSCRAVGEGGIFSCY